MRKNTKTGAFSAIFAQNPASMAPTERTDRQKMFLKEGYYQKIFCKKHKIVEETQEKLWYSSNERFVENIRMTFVDSENLGGNV